MKDLSCAGSMVQKIVVCVVCSGPSGLDYLCPNKPRGALAFRACQSAASSSPDHRTAGASGGAAAAGYLPGAFPH